MGAASAMPMAHPDPAAGEKRPPHARHPSLIEHGLISAAVISAAGLVWISTSWSVAHLVRDWGYCQVLPATGVRAEASAPQARPKPGSIPSASDILMLLLTAMLKSGMTTADSLWTFANPWQRQNPLDKELKDYRVFSVDGSDPTASSTALPKGAAFQPLYKRLNHQATMIAFLEWRNCDVAAYFLNRQLSTFSMGTLTALATVASLFWISKQGWEKTNNGIINIGITAGLITTGAITYSNLFGFIGSQSNSNVFTAAYLRDAELSQKLRSAAATARFKLGGGKDNGPAEQTFNLTKMEDFIPLIQVLDKQISETNITALSIDASFVQQTSQKLMQMGGNGR